MNFKRTCIPTRAERTGEKAIARNILKEGKNMNGSCARGGIQGSLLGWYLDYVLLIHFRRAHWNTKIKKTKAKEQQVPEFFFLVLFQIKVHFFKNVSMSSFNWQVITVNSQQIMKVLLWIRHRFSLPPLSHNEPENTVLV